MTTANTPVLFFLCSAPENALVIGITADDHAALMRSRDQRITRIRDRDTRRTYFTFKGCPLTVLAKRMLIVE